MTDSLALDSLGSSQNPGLGTPSQKPKPKPYSRSRVLTLILLKPCSNFLASTVYHLTPQKNPRKPEVHKPQTAQTLAKPPIKPCRTPVDPLQEPKKEALRESLQEPLNELLKGALKETNP